MVIDFSRLNSAPPLPGSTRSNANQEAGSATQAAPAAKTAENTGAQTPSPSGESVHLSPQAQQLQKVSDALRDQPVVNQERVAALKQAIADGSYTVDSNKVASKLLNIEAER